MGGEPRIGKLRLILTSACNLDCSFCHAEFVPPELSSRTLPLEAFRAVVTYFAARGTRRFDITGGEPLLLPDLRTYLQTLRLLVPDARIELTTNATRPLIQLVGLVDHIYISVHFSKPGRHASWPGSKAIHATILEHIRTIQPSRIAHMNTVILDDGTNVEELPGLMAFCEQARLGSWHLYYQIGATDRHVLQDRVLGELHRAGARPCSRSLWFEAFRSPVGLPIFLGDCRCSGANCEECCRSSALNSLRVLPDCSLSRCPGGAIPFEPDVEGFEERLGGLFRMERREGTAVQWM